MRISGAMPIHNEAKYLPFTLESLKNVNLDELVVVFDRCTDKSEQIVDNFNPRYTVRTFALTKRNWSFPTAEVFKLAFESCSGDVVYSLAGDCWYNPEIFRVDWSNLDFASFPYKDYPLYGNFRSKVRCNWINLYRFLTHVLYPKLVKKPEFSGIYAFKKHVYNSIPRNFDIPSEDIWFLKQAYAKGFRYKYFHNLFSLHLRPAVSQAKQEAHGRAKVFYGYPLWKVIGHSIILWKPSTLKGYLKAKAKMKCAQVLLEV